MKISFYFAALHLIIGIIGSWLMYDLGPNLEMTIMHFLGMFVVIFNVLATGYWIVQLIKESVNSY